MPYTRGVEEVPPKSPSILYIFIMKTELNRDLMIGMLRKGLTGNQILQILDVIVPETEVQDETEAVSA
jgi:hypothetical protein